MMHGSMNIKNIQ